MRRRKTTLQDLEYTGSAAAGRGADIEILDRHEGEASVLVPNAVRINGVEIAIPQDATIRVHDLRTDQGVVVTLTLYARSISIRSEDA